HLRVLENDQLVLALLADSATRQQPVVTARQLSGALGRVCLSFYGRNKVRLIQLYIKTQRHWIAANAFLILLDFPRIPEKQKHATVANSGGQFLSHLNHLSIASLLHHL